MNIYTYLSPDCKYIYMYVTYIRKIWQYSSHNLSTASVSTKTAKSLIRVRVASGGLIVKTHVIKVGI